MSATLAHEESHSKGSLAGRLPQLAIDVLIALCTCKLLLHLFTSVRHYGYFRDELYYLDLARHLDWGYVDCAPLVARLCESRTPVGRFPGGAADHSCAGGHSAGRHHHTGRPRTRRQSLCAVHRRTLHFVVPRRARHERSHDDETTPGVPKSTRTTVSSPIGTKRHRLNGYGQRTDAPLIRDLRG
jgi:hypothetical protein